MNEDHIRHYTRIQWNSLNFYSQNRQCLRNIDKVGSKLSLRKIYGTAN